MKPGEEDNETYYPSGGLRRGIQLAFLSCKLIACHPQDGWTELIR